jgi:hypothetical protein
VEVWVGGPDEGFGIGVCLGDEAVDSDLQVDDGSEHAALEATARELGEEAFDRIEPGCGGRGEVERPAGMPGQPLARAALSSRSTMRPVASRLQPSTL